MAIKITYTDISTNTELYQEIMSDEERKALETDMLSIFEWISNAWRNKARQCIDSIVSEVSEYDPKKLSKNKKIEIVRIAQVKTAAQRQKALETLIAKGI